MAARIYDPFAADYELPEETGAPGLSLPAPAATAIAPAATTAPKIYDPFATDYEPPAPDQGVVLPSIKRTAGQMVESLGTTIEDITGPNVVTEGLRDFGGGVVRANPSQINSVGDVLDKPWTTVKEAVAEQVPQLGATYAGAAGGAALGGLIAGPPGAVVGGALGAFAPSAVQSYAEIRDKQKETGEEDITKAVLGAAGSGWLEQRFGLEKFAKKAGVKGFGEVLEAGPEGASRLWHGAKEGLKTALIEGPGTEIPQTAIERFAGGQEIGTPEAFEEYAVAGVKGAIGGGAIGGGLGFVAPRAQQPTILPAAATGGEPQGDAGATRGAAGPPPSPPPSEGGGWVGVSPGVSDPSEAAPDVGLADLDPEQRRHMEAIGGQGPLTAAAAAGGQPSSTPASATARATPASGPEARREAPSQLPSRRSRGALSPLGAEQADRARADIAAEQVRTAELAARGPLSRAAASAGPDVLAAAVGEVAGGDEGSPPMASKATRGQEGGQPSLAAGVSVSGPGAELLSASFAPATQDGVDREGHTSRHDAVYPKPGQPAQDVMDTGFGINHGVTASPSSVAASPAGVIDEAAHQAATSPHNDLPEPTEPQREAGNYQKGHVRYAGLDISIENPRGSKRSGVDPSGKPWEVEMGAHYGYVRRTEGKDGEQVDVYLASDREDTPAFVVDQVDPKTGRFDEHKVVLGAASRGEAEQLYDAHFSDGSGATRRVAITELPMEGFKAWLKGGNTKKPIAGQKLGPPTPALPTATPTDTPPLPASASPGASQEAAFSPEAHWNGLAQEERLALGQQAGWAKRFAQGFAKQPWAKLSPAAQNVIARNITPDASAAAEVALESQPLATKPVVAQKEASAEPQTDTSAPSLGTRLRDPQLQAALRHMATQAGWAQRGGEMLRDAQDQVTGRTTWLPNEPWYAAIPERLDREATAKAVKKALAGKKLGGKEERVLGYMLDAFEREREEGQLSPEVQSAPRPEEEADLEAREEREAIIAEAGRALDALSDADINALIGGDWTPFDSQVRLVKDEDDRETPQGDRGDEEADSRGEVGAATEAGPEARVDGERPVLEGYTAADLAEREQARLDGERKEAEDTAAAQRKREADRGREGFVLTGSDNVADELEARGQRSLLDEPAIKQPNGQEPGSYEVQDEPSSKEPAETAGDGSQASPARQEGDQTTSPAATRDSKAATRDSKTPGAAPPAKAERLKKQPVEAEAKPPPNKPIEDVGEKIGGARKDRWRERGLRLADLEGMSGGEEAQYVTKENVWPAIDYPKLIADGATPHAAALIKIIRDRLATAPQKDTPEGRRHYVEMIGIAREELEKAKTTEEVKAVGTEVFSRIGWYKESGAVSGWRNDEIRAKAFSVYQGRSNPFSVKWKDSRKADKMLEEGWPAKKKAKTKTQAAREEGKLPERPHLDDVQRTGEDRRQGRDVTGEDFLKEFGFRGVEHGLWAAQDERQKALNLAYEALHDLAGTLGVPPKALSLNGTLGLAFGARGSGQFAAHYESGKLVINLTKLRGAGTLAHEWGHGLDHYFGELDRPDAYQGGARGATGWMGKGRRVKRENLRPEMAAAFDGVMKAMFERETDKAEAVRATELRLESLQGEIAKGEQRLTKAEQAEHPDKDWLKRMRAWLDGARRSETNVKATLAELRNEPRRIGGYGNVASSYFKEASKLAGSGDYWTRPTELFARAFEAYVFDRIGEQGQVSQYLVQGVEADRYGSSAYKGNPYPVGLEREAINAAFDKLFAAMQTRETEKGTALYSYLGERAAKVPQHAFAAARAYAQEGIPMEEIRKVTGWFRGPDSAWRFEISDEASTFRPGYRKGKTVGEVLEHGALFDNYPSLANIGIVWRSDLPEKVLGGYSHAENAFHLNGKRTLQGIRSTLLHELQHAVQVIEGFARGGSPHDEALVSAVAAMGIDVNDRDAVFGAYERLLGEVEARDVQARAELTAEELRERPPYVSQGIPESDFIVRQEGEIAAEEDPGEPAPTSPFVRGRAQRNQKPGPAGLSASRARETLSGRFGGGVGRLIEAEILRIVQHESELPRHLNDGKGGIRGVYDRTGHPLTGEGAETTWMVADNLTAADAPRIFLHEIGVHYGLERMVGSDKYQNIIAQVKRMEAEGDAAVLAARAAIPNGTPKAAVDDEMVAYLVEKHPELAIVKRIVAAIRAFLFRMGLIKNIRPEDVVALAKAAARRAARGVVMNRAGAAADLTPELLFARRQGPAPQKALSSRANRVLDALRQSQSIRGYATFRSAREKVRDLSKADFDAGVLEMRERFGLYNAEREAIFSEKDSPMRAHALEDREHLVEDPKNKNGPYGFQAVYSGMFLGALPREFQEARYSRGAQTDIARGQAAMDRVIRSRGDEMEAMERDGLGKIAFLWGNVGRLDARKGRYVEGGGVAHIIAQRDLEGKDGQATARAMPEVIALGDVGTVYGPPGGQRVNIHHQGKTAVLSLYHFGQERTWLLTGWEEGPGGAEGVNPNDTYAPTPSGIRAEEGAGPESTIEAAGGPVKGPQAPLFSRAGPPPSPPSQGGEQGPAPDPNTPEGSAEALGRIGEAMRSTRHGWDAIKSRVLEDWRPAWLGLFTRRQLVDIGQGMVPQLADYDRAAQAMDADRNRFDDEAHEVAEIAAAFVRKDRKEADQLFDLMHAATLAGVEPADKFRASIDRNEAYAEMSSLRRRMRGRSGEADVLQAQIDEIQVRLGNERVRKAAHPGLARRWIRLHPDAKVVYAQMRDLYKRRFDEREEALIQRIRDAEADERWKARLIADIRHRFETARLSAPYFPLTRFGDYWVAAVNPDGEKEYHLRESTHQQKALIQELTTAGYQQIAHGFKMETLFEQQGASAGFVSNIIKLLDKGMRNSPGAAEIKDSIYQMYLQSLPELSARKHWIHREKVPGFSKDALRGFAKQMFHGNRQLAKLRHQTAMEKALVAARKSVRHADDPNRAAQLVNEMQKRDEWIKNPTTSTWANVAGSLGFLWYLTAPASAIVNVTQTPLVAYPLLAARHGWGKSAAALNRAAGDYFKGRFSVEGALQGEDLAAYKRFLADGPIDKTQSHDLAGMSETPSAIYSGRAAKLMRASSFLFHRAERMNREVTALAAFRLARAEGLGVDAAYEQAKATTWEAHFDYSNSNKARFIQGDAARVLFMFKQFSQHMTYLLARSAQQSLKGLTPAVRREARLRLTGMLGMHALFAGALGMPLMGTLTFVMNALFDDDDDEPYDFETSFRNFLAEAFGPEIGQAIARGPVESLTKLGISNRVGLSDLWVREPDKTLEGRGLVEYWTEQLLGPLGGIALKAGTAYDMFQDGHTMRALESMQPTAISSGLRMLRYAGEGVQSLRGDPVMEDVSTWNLLWQGAGFSPAKLGQKYDANRALKDLEQRIETRSQRLINRWWLARRTGDLEGVQEAMAEIGRFNASTIIRENPRARITPATLLASMQQRRNYSRRAEGGIIVDRRLSRLGERVRFGG